MSHFVLFCVPNEENSKQLLARSITPEQAIEPMLEPYDEQTQVEEYEVDCSCICLNRHRLLNEACATKFGDDYIHVKRSEHKEWRQANLSEEELREFSGEKSNKHWQSILATFISFSDQIEAEIDHRDKSEMINTDCEDCNGTGIVKTRYNPKSKWDWYQVGGRWTGFLSDYNPLDDPNNVKECFHCQGKLRIPITKELPLYWISAEQSLFGSQSKSERIEEVTSVKVALEVDGMNAQEAIQRLWPERAVGSDHDSIECWVCKGTGTQVAWPTGYSKHKGDVQPITLLKSLLIANDSDKYISFGLCLESDEEESTWLENGEMGWWACISNENVDWPEDFKKMIFSIPDNRAVVVVDCHI